MEKKGAIEMEKLVEIILAIAAFIVIATIVYFIIDAIKAEEMALYSCWATNGIKSSNFVFKKYLPSSCVMFQPEQQMEEKDVAKMLKDTWWMYGKGEWNFGWSDNEVAVYYFIAGKDISVESLVNYLATHKDEAELPKGNIIDSDYNYLQKGASYQTLCFGKGVANDGWTLKQGKKYFINFFDDAGIGEKGDKIIIATKPNVKQEKAYYCKSFVGSVENFVIADDCDIVEFSTGKCVEA